MELKAIRGGDIHDAVEFHRPANGEYPEDTDYYLKSEVDRVIAELKAQKAQAEDDCAYWKAKAQRERHHKFKRCVAMAERWLFAFYATNKCNDKFYLRNLKYRELADQFNPNSTATKENNNG